MSAGARALRQPGERPVDLRQRLVGFEEEVAAERDVGEGAVHDVEVHHHELAARDLVLAVVTAAAVVVGAGERWPRDGMS